MRKETAIQDDVFSFYACHKEECDKLYDLAQDKHIYSIYEIVSDPIVVNSLFAKTSTIILTANKFERNILHQRVKKESQIKRIEIELLTATTGYNKVYGYWFEWGDYSVLHIHANVTGSYTVGGAADIIRWVIHNDYLYPTSIISFGLCFGTLEDTSNLGDVIISKKIYPYFVGAKINGDVLRVVDDNIFLTSSSLIQKINDLENNNFFNSLPFEVKFERYISGDAVISSNRIRTAIIKTTTQTIYAGDMEGYGLYKECGSYSIPCFLLKSICDWGIEKNHRPTNDSILLLQNKLSEVGGKLNSRNEAILLISTMKDRIQAYSVNCAFNALNVLVSTNTLNPSVFNEITNWFYSFNGVATSCNSVQSAIERITKDYNYSISNAFIHRILMILDEKGIITCDSPCKKENRKDKCNTLIHDATIIINSTR